MLKEVMLVNKSDTVKYPETESVMNILEGIKDFKVGNSIKVCTSQNVGYIKGLEVFNFFLKNLRMSNIVCIMIDLNK